MRNLFTWSPKMPAIGNGGLNFQPVQMALYTNDGGRTGLGSTGSDLSNSPCNLSLKSNQYQSAQFNCNQPSVKQCDDKLERLQQQPTSAFDDSNSRHHLHSNSNNHSNHNNNNVSNADADHSDVHMKMDDQLIVANKRDAGSVTVGSGNDPEDTCITRENKKSTRDPLSHRIIEKRRRDRMNKCLSDLSRLIPSHYIKKGRGRIEKTEIVEMAIKHIKNLEQQQQQHQQQLDHQQQQQQQSSQQQQPQQLQQAKQQQQTRANTTISTESADKEVKLMTINSDTNRMVKFGSATLDGDEWQSVTRPHQIYTENYQLGYRECISEAIRFMVEFENLLADDLMCIRLVNHLNRHIEQLIGGQTASEPGVPSAKRSKVMRNESLPSSVIKMERIADDEMMMSELDSNSNSRHPPLLSSSSSSQQCASAHHHKYFVTNLIANDHAVSTLSPRDQLMKCRMFTCSPNNDTSSEGTQYKYKKSIKERFQADQDMHHHHHNHHHHHHHRSPVTLQPSSSPITQHFSRDTLTPNTVISNSSSSLSDRKQLLAARQAKNTRDCQSATSSAYLCIQDRCQTPATTITNQVIVTGDSGHDNSAATITQRNQLISARSINSIGRTVTPGFLLHPLADYYIPIEVDLSSVGGDLDKQSVPTMAAGSQVLHPVSISVNFCYRPYNLNAISYIAPRIYV